MAAKIKVGLIGLGFMGTTHFDIYKNNPKAEIVAIADVNPAKLKGDISSVIGNIGGGDNSKPLNLKGIKTYAKAMALINDPEVQLIDICAPTVYHADLAIAALNAGKHVLCEKPVARTAKDAAKILAAAKKAKGFFAVGMCIRYWPEYIYARDFFKSGKAGKLISANFRRLSPNIRGNAWKDWFSDGELSGGALLDLHLHDTDEVLYFFGKPKAVTSFGANNFRTKDACDHVLTSYDFGNGSLVIAEGGWAAAKGITFEMSFQIICEKATLKLDSNGFAIHYENGKTEKPSFAKELPTGWHKEIDYMLDSIITGKKPTKYITAEEYLQAMKIVEAEQKSVDTGKTVKIKY